MQKKFGKKNILLVIFILILLLVGGFFYLSLMKKSLWEQAVTNVLEVTAQGGKTFEIYMDQGNHALKGRAAIFSQYSSAETEEIGKKLDLFEDGDPFFAVLDLTHGTIIYNSHEQNVIDAETLKIYQALPSEGLTEPYINEYDGRRIISYYECFTFADGARGMVRNSVLLSEMADRFSLSFYDSAGFSYIVNARGDILFRSGRENGNRTYQNVYDVVALDDNTPNEVESFRNGMSGGKRGVMQLNFGGVEHIFAFVPLKSTDDWYLVSIVPNRVIMERANQMMMRTQVMIAGIAAALLIFAIFLLLNIQHRRQVREKETEVRYREQLFNLLANNTNDVFLMLSAGYEKVEYISPNVERVIGISRESVEKDITCLQNIIHDVEHEERIKKLSELPMNESETFTGKYVHKTTGEQRWFTETIYHTEIENTERYIVVLADRTEERQKEATLVEALKIAKVANESKSSFLANMSHDIRTPMNAIVGLTTLLKRDADNPEKVRKHTEKIASSSHHLLGLINDVLDMSKIETGKTTLNMGEFELTQLVQELDSIIRLQAGAKKQSFDIVMEDIIAPNLIGDKQRISQVMMNILSNAVKYTLNEGQITMTVKQLGQITPDIVRTRFIVSDNGIGMSEEYQQEIFQPFTREIRTTVNQIQGTGLGMAITKNLVELMGGTISVISEQGVGSTFTIDFDLQIVHQGIKEKPVVEQEEEVSLNGYHFLCAEDNELNAEILCELLSMEGARATIAINGKDAVELFTSAPKGTYDAILMDVQMPILDGYGATRSIRASEHPEASSIPIVAMTANAFAEDIQASLEAGMNAHIAKPIDMKKLKITLGQFLKP